MIFVARVELPSFDDKVHWRLRSAEIDLFRIPRASDQPTHAYVELEAESPDEARKAILEAVPGATMVTDAEWAGISELQSDGPVECYGLPIVLWPPSAIPA
jgi:hypothetical protein